jgi:hypothetical protein
MSHMLDCQLFGLAAGGHHVVNVIFHILNAILVMVVLFKFTGSVWPSVCVGCLFGLHPVNVESVAWVAERKNLLSTFFMLLSLWCYARSVQQARRAWFWAAFGVYACGLMSKSMLVTFPFILLLLDAWPLRRLAPEKKQRTSNPVAVQRLLALVAEKWAFFAGSALICVVTILSQKSAHAIYTLSVIPLSKRLINAAVSYLIYIGQLFWPSNCAVLYPANPTLGWMHGIGAIAIVCAVSILAVRLWPRRPYFAIGWLWYLGTLVPVIGIVQVGIQSHADRYCYLPILGLFIIIAWGAFDLSKQFSPRILPYAVFWILVCTAFGIISHQHTKFWTNPYQLFFHADKVTRGNYFAQTRLGELLETSGHVNEALTQYRRAIHNDPNFYEAIIKIGVLLGKMQSLDEAHFYFTQAIRLRPELAEPFFNDGLLYSYRGSMDTAIAYYTKALERDSTHVPTCFGIG